MLIGNTVSTKRLEEISITKMFNTKDFMEQQQHGFSDSTPRMGSDRLQKSAKSLLSAFPLMSISQISSYKYESGHFDPF